MEALGQLTGGIAHDFNNMLTGILGLSTLALERHVDDPSGKLASYLREIARVGERGRELVGRLMRFARPVAAGAPPPAARPLQPIVEEALVMLAPALSPRISVRLQAEAGLPELCFTEVDMHQVLTNLLINARDAMGGEGEVVVTLARAATEGAECTSCGQRAHGEQVSLRVQDSGPGIAPEFRARIFDPFFTTKDIGKGTGLGLAMVHSLVHQIGGHIVVHGEPGRGTCFELLLPVTPPRAVDAAAEAQATAASEPAATVVADDATPDGPGCALTGAPMDSPPGAPMDAPTEAAAVPARGPVAAAPKRRRSGRRVWLIDDAGTAFAGLEPVLRAAGYSVSRHTDPLRVLQALRTTPVAADHLVTVQSMARMTGGELAQATLALQPAPSVLLCAGPDDGIDDMALQALGIRHVLRRPVSAGTLIHALAAAERQREAGQPA
jgi:CheY-like chemotaxis protein